MRKIKFKAWHKLQKEMSKSFTFVDIVRESNHFMWSPQTLKDIIFIQYTGLKDKNGKEIWESDIVKWPAGARYGKTYYKNVFVQFDQDNNTIRWTLNDSRGLKDKTWGGFHNQWEKNRMEVIGNIYENLELLK